MTSITDYRLQGIRSSFRFASRVDDNWFKIIQRPRKQVVPEVSLVDWITMSFPVDIVTLGGGVATITARDDWSVWDLLCEVEKSTDARRNLCKLITSEGVELSSGPLSDFCLAEEGRRELLYLVKLPKSQEEVEWFEKWSQEAPAWVKKLAEAPVGYKELDAIHADACTSLYASWRPTLVWPNVQTFHPTKVLKESTSTCEARKELVLKTGGDVLAIMKKTKSELQGILRHQSFKQNMFSLDWGRSQQTATWEAVCEAIKEEPCKMLAPLESNMDISEIVDLVVPAVTKYPEVYERLPDYLMEEREVLYAAMEADPVLREEFLRVAGRSEIRDWKEWQYPKASRNSRCRWSKRCRED